MLKIHFKTVNGNPGYRTLTDKDKVDANATHVFRELNGGTWRLRARSLTGTGPWAAANYMRAVHKNGGKIELIGTL